MKAGRDARDAEETLAAAILTGDEVRVREVFAALCRDDIEFTGRCYAAAITMGMVETSLMFGRARFCLDVTQEPAVRAALESGAGGMRGLRSFLEAHRYCKARRTYYLPVVQADASLAPIGALLREGVGLNEADKTELLSLAIRFDKVELARLLALHGAKSPWLDAVSPHCSADMLAFLLENASGGSCCVRDAWFKLYFREPAFAKRLASIVMRCEGDRCENVGATIVTLARAGECAALAHALSWPEARACFEALDEALEAARAEGQVEAMALLIEAASEGADACALEPLAW